MRTGSHNHDNIILITWWEVSRDFRPSVFFTSNNTPWGPELKSSWILLRIRRDMLNFLTQKSCMRCQLHPCMILLGSPFNYTHFCSSGIGQFTNIPICFLIDILFKCCKGCSNRSSIVNAVSLTPYKFLIFCIVKPFRLWFSIYEVVQKVKFACGVKFYNN
jgi:hypothetical protein